MTDHPNITLSTGSHRTRDDGMCMMEAAAMLAGEPHTDRPDCVDPVIAAFCRTWQDRLDDEQRADLAAPLVQLVIGTRTTPEDQDRRAIMVGDWCWRTVLPMWLDLVPSLADHAAALRAQPEATTADQLATLGGGVGDAAWAAAGAAARDAAWDAARDAAWAAARAAAWAAAGDAAGAAAWAAAGAAAAWAAAGDAARDAAWTAAWAASRAAAGDAAGAAARAAAWAAARDASRAAARAAARDAAWTAAWAAARAALDPTVRAIQETGADLIRRMCEVGR